jgi:predicted MPP superfamily phosphohydrolase
MLLAGVTAVGAGGLGLLGYAVGVEPHWVEVVQETLVVESLPPAWHGKRLVQISDLHIGRRVDPQYLAQALRMARDLQPDLLVITGDIVHGNDGLHCRDAVGLLQANLSLSDTPTVAILGNHDYGADWRESRFADALSGELAGAGITVLRHTVTEIDGFRLVGIDDRWGTNWSASQAAAALSSSKPHLVLSHNPDVCDEPIWGDYAGWILSGHTHGGQCKPPFLPPPMLPVQNKRYTAGKIPLEGGRTLYINRALGYLHRVRFLVRPEITLFTLVPTVPLEEKGASA